MAKFKIGDEVVAVGECQETRIRFGITVAMEYLINKQEVMKVTQVGKPGWLVSTSYWNWAPEDLEIYNPSLINE